MVQALEVVETVRLHARPPEPDHHREPAQRHQRVGRSTARPSDAPTPPARPRRGPGAPHPATTQSSGPSPRLRAFHVRASSWTRTPAPSSPDVQPRGIAQWGANDFKMVLHGTKLHVDARFSCRHDSRQLVPAGLAARPRRGYFFRAIPAEPDIKRAVSFIDGQNLYRHAKDAFGHHHPSYDPRRLVDAVCADRDWVNHGVRFYTGFPSADRTPMWHGYWARRLTAMRRSGIAVTSRPLRYRAEGFDCPTSRPRASRRTREGHRPAARARHRTYGAQRGARRGGRVQSEPESHGAPDAGKAATCYPAHLAAGKLAESGQEVNISAAVPHICSKASQRSSRLRVRSVTSSSLHALTSLSS